MGEDTAGTWKLPDTSYYRREYVLRREEAKQKIIKKKEPGAILEK